MAGPTENFRPLGRIFNTAVANDTTNFFATALQVSKRSIVRVQILLDTAARLDPRLTNGANTVVGQFNGGNSIEANVLRILYLVVDPAEALNFRHSAAGGATVLYMLVDELMGAIAGPDPVSNEIVVAVGATGLGKTEDSAHVTGDVGVMMLGVRQDALAVLAADGDYIPFVVDASGRLWTHDDVLDAALETSRFAVNLIAGQIAITGGAGVVAANTPRMTLASDDPAVVALQIMDDWDETNRAAVNLIAGQVAITAGAGAVALNTPRMTLASDDPAVVALQVMDDWDETNRAAVNLIAGQVAITAGAGIVAANTPRVTLASDDPAVVALQVMDDWDETNRAAVNLIAGQVAITAGAGAVALNTPRVTLASDDPAVVALQIMDDWDETNRAAVNLIAGQVAITGGAGTVAANTPRMTLASDDPAVAGIGATGDAAATPGGTGSLSAKLRNTTSLLDAIKTAAELLDNAVSGASLKVTAHEKEVAKDVAIQAAAYAAEDCFGGKFVFSQVARTSGVGVTLMSIQFVDEDDMKPEVHLFLADRAFASAPADNASMSGASPAAFGATDRDFVYGPFSILTSDWENIDGNTAVARIEPKVKIKAPNSATDYGSILKVGSAVGAAGGVRNMRVRIGVIQD